jgi:hypothetical protein
VADYSNRFDLRSQILFFEDSLSPEDSALDYEFWCAKLHHEKSHWLRLEGTSFGLMFNLLKYAKCRYSHEMIRDLSPNKKNKILKSRMKKSPILSRKKGCNPNFIGKDFALFGQFCIDLDLTYTILLNGFRVTLKDDAYNVTPKILDEAVMNSVVDAWSFSNEILVNVFTKFCSVHDAENHFDLKPHPAYFLLPFGLEITTADILECACKIDEYLSSPDDLSDELKYTILESLRHSSRNTPWLCFSKISTSFEVFLSIVDFAMNPELPFLGNNNKVYSWADLYPPLRFLAAIEILDTAGTLKRFSKLTHFDKITFLERRTHFDYFNCTYKKPQFSLLFELVKAPIYGSLCYCILCSLLLLYFKGTFNDYIVFPSLSGLFSGSESLIREFGEELLPLLAPPIMVGSSPNIFSGIFACTDMHKFTSDYLISSVERELLHFVLFGEGQFDDSFMPKSADTTYTYNCWLFDIPEKDIYPYVKSFDSALYIRSLKEKKAAQPS